MKLEEEEAGALGMGGCPRSSIQPPDCSIRLSGSCSLSLRFPLLLGFLKMVL